MNFRHLRVRKNNKRSAMIIQKFKVVTNRASVFKVRISVVLAA
jgi:hypothetical protein